MKSIRICKSYQINDIEKSSSVIERFIYLLNQSKYYTEKDNNKIHFKRHPHYTTHRSDNSTEGSIILRSGTIFFNFEEKILKICWLINLFSIYFRSFIIGIIISLCYYFFYSNNIIDTIIILLSLFLVILVFSIIVIKFKVAYFNNSVI